MGGKSECLRVRWANESSQQGGAAEEGQELLEQKKKVENQTEFQTIRLNLVDLMRVCREKIRERQEKEAARERGPHMAVLGKEIRDLIKQIRLERDNLQGVLDKDRDKVNASKKDAISRE